jgi:hypothetical protein
MHDPAQQIMALSPWSQTPPGWSRGSASDSPKRGAGIGGGPPLQWPAAAAPAWPFTKAYEPAAGAARATAELVNMARATRPAATCLIPVIELLRLDSTGWKHLAGLLKHFRCYHDGRRRLIIPLRRGEFACPAAWFDTFD